MPFVFNIMKCEAVTAYFTEESLVAAVAAAIQLYMQGTAAQTAFFSYNIKPL